MTPDPGAGAVRIHIGTLILDGLPQVDAEVVAAALRDELTRLLTADPIRTDGEQTAPRPMTELRAGPVELEAGDDPRHLGMKIGRALHATLLQRPASRPAAAVTGPRPWGGPP